jgi:hypothetical protein
MLYSIVRNITTVALSPILYSYYNHMGWSWELTFVNKDTAVDDGELIF